MEANKVFVIGKPCFYLVDIDKHNFALLGTRLTATYKDAVVRYIRGRSCVTPARLFNEFAAALQFPLYFGENWNAFDECICDLGWLEGNAYILLIDDLFMLLNSLDEEDVRIFMRILNDANQEWMNPNQYIPRERPPTAFHVVFQCTSATMPVISSRLAQLGCACEIL